MSDTCKAVLEREELTRRIMIACNPTTEGAEVLPPDGSERALLVWASLLLDGSPDDEVVSRDQLDLSPQALQVDALRGIVAEYTDGGDQMAEACTCDDPLHIYGPAQEPRNPQHPSQRP